MWTTELCSLLLSIIGPAVDVPSSQQRRVGLYLCVAQSYFFQYLRIHAY